MLLICANIAQSADTIVVNAAGTPTRSCTFFIFCTDTYPDMSVYINGVLLARNSVTASATDYTYSTTLPISGAVQVDVLFDNDLFYSSVVGFFFGFSGNRDLYLNSVKIGNQTVYPNNAGVTVDLGANYTAATDGANVISYGSGLTSNGALRITTSYAQCCSATKIAEYSLDETSWTGITNETKDTAGYTDGPFDGQGVGTPKPTATSSNPAKSGTTGTCGYATFSGTSGGSAFTLDSLPVSTSNGAKTSVSFWMYWNGADNQMPMGWYEYDLWLYNGKFGFNTNTTDIYGITSSGLANGWHHIVAVFTNGSVTSNKLYIDGASVALSQQFGSPNNSKAVVASTLRISGYGINDFFRLSAGRIDEVKVYNGELTQAQVTADYNATHACTGMPNLLANYHFEESTWTTAAGQVIDASNNGYHGSVAKSSNSQRAQTEDSVSNRFVANSPGTCGYAIFGSNTATQGPIVLPSSMPNLTGSFTFATWFTELSGSFTARRLFADDYNEAGGGFIFSINDGGTGKLRFAKRSSDGSAPIILDSAYAMTAGTKYFVAVSVNAVNQTATIYVYDTSGTLLNQTTGPMGYFGAANAGNMTIGGAQTSSGNTYLLHGRMDEVSIYNSALNQNQILALLQTSHNCAGSNIDATNFNCIAEQESTSGTNVSTGRLYTQVVNTPFNIKVVALKSNSNAETSFSASSDRTAVLRFRDQNTNALINFNGGETANSKNVLFTTTNTTGIVDITNISIPKSYQNLRCEISEGTISAAPSSDNFSVRPYQLVLSTSNAGADATGTSTTATPAIKAGSSFNLTATATRSSTVTDTDAGYNGTPTAHSTLNDTSSPKVVAHTGAVTKGKLLGSFGASVAGVATGNFNYDEVGYFKLNQYAFVDDSFTTVDQSGGDCLTGSNAYATTADASGKVGCYLYSPATNYFGRFTPDHFEISNISSPSQCGGFNYYGQEFPTTFKITAKDHPSVNTTTQNYTGGFAKLGLTTWSSGYNFSAIGLPAGANLTSGATAPTGTWSSGVATITASHKIDRDNNPMLPATVSINVAPTDADNITTASTALVSNVPFKYGRINYPNTFGSELLPLAVPIQVQYWNGLAYVLNIADSCTNLSNINFGMSNYKSNLSGSPMCETRMTSVIKTSLGLYTAILSPPGWGNTGSVDLTLFTNNTAVGNTCVGITPTAATSRNYPWFGAPKAKRATFGIFKSPIIYMHENF